MSPFTNCVAHDSYSSTNRATKQNNPIDTIAVANAELQKEAEYIQEKSSANNGDSNPNTPSHDQKSRIRVIRRSSRWKNNPRQTQREDNETVEAYHNSGTLG